MIYLSLVSSFVGVQPPLARLLVPSRYYAALFYSSSMPFFKLLKLRLGILAT